MSQETGRGCRRDSTGSTIEKDVQIEAITLLRESMRFLQDFCPIPTLQSAFLHLSFFHPSIHLPCHPSIHLSISPSSIFMFPIHLSLHPLLHTLSFSIHPSVCPPISPSTPHHRSPYSATLCGSLHPSTSPSIYPPIPFLPSLPPLLYSFLFRSTSSSIASPRGASPVRQTETLPFKSFLFKDQEGQQSLVSPISSASHWPITCSCWSPGGLIWASLHPNTSNLLH